MALYHLHVKNISRSDGRTIVAAAAYRAGETLPNEAEERLSAFGGRRDVLHTEICLPAVAPDWMHDRAKLWNAVEAAEKRKDARLAKEIEIALPRELSPQAWLTVARQMAALYVARGHVVDFAIHDDGSGHNPHVHMLLTTRSVVSDGFGLKIRAADEFSFVKEARASWAAIANSALAAAGISAAIDPRSHRARNIESEPTKHRGPNPEERRAKRRQRNQSMEETDRSRLSPAHAAGYAYIAQVWQSRYSDIPWRLWPPANRLPPAELTVPAEAAWNRFWADVDDQSGIRQNPAAAELGPYNPLVLHDMKNLLSPAELRQKIDEALESELYPYLLKDGFMLSAALALADQDSTSAVQNFHDAMRYAAEEYDRDNMLPEPLPWVATPDASDWTSGDLPKPNPDYRPSPMAGSEWWRKPLEGDEPERREQDDREPER